MKNSNFLNRARLTGHRSAGILFVFVVAFLLSVQTGCTRQRIYENIYEGIRVRNELQTPPPERGEGQMSPDYWQYQNNLRTSEPDTP